MSGNKVLLILLEVWLPQCFCSFDIKQNRQRLSSWCLTWSPNLLCISATTSKLIRLCAVHQQMGSTYTVIHIKSRWRMYYRGTQCWGWCVKSSIKAGGYSLGEGVPRRLNGERERKCGLIILIYVISFCSTSFCTTSEATTPWWWKEGNSPNKTRRNWFRLVEYQRFSQLCI